MLGVCREWDQLLIVHNMYVQQQARGLLRRETKVRWIGCDTRSCVMDEFGGRSTFYSYSNSTDAIRPVLSYTFAH